MNKVVIGNFEGQANKNFPADCELFSSLQTNTAIIMVLGNIAGDKAILKGCELEKNDTSRKTGYVFIRTKDYPNGEILLWEGGSITGGMYVKLETVAVTAQGYNYENAYTVRSLGAGVGIENYKWQDFHTPKNIKEIEGLINTQNIAIAALAPAPLGVIQIWGGSAAGDAIPKGYKVCDGARLVISEFGELHKAIGRLHTPHSTPSGYFCLPDLRARFIVGFSSSDYDYNSVAKTGGEKKHQLTTSEMPRHNHIQNLHNEGNGGWKSGGENSSPESVSWHNSRSNDGTTEYAGNGYSHENRPPYYALVYIIRVK